MSFGKWSTALLAVVLTAAGTGCEENEQLLVERAGGNLDARIEDDPLRPAVLLIGGVVDTVFASPRLGYSGVLTGAVRLEISEHGRRFHDLGTRRVEIPIGVAVAPDRAEPQFEDLTAPAGRYRVIRLTLRRASVRLEAGSVLRDTVLERPVVLEVVSIDRDGEATLERSVESFRLAAGSEVDLAFDLNSHVWVTRENVLRERLSELAIRAPINIAISGRETLR